MFKYGVTKEQQYLINNGILLEYTIKDKKEIEQYWDLMKKGLPLPDDIYYSSSEVSDSFFKLIRIVSEDKTNDALLSLMASTLQTQRDDITTIKHCVMFFTVIAVISLVATIFASCSALM